MLRVGQKVVCVDAGCQPGRRWIPSESAPIKGEIYTVHRIGLVSLRGMPCIDLVEIKRPDDYSYGEWRFRPIVEPKQEISFTTGADPESERWDNRKPAPAPVRKRETAR